MVEFAIRKDSVDNGTAEKEGATYEITPGGGYHTYEPPKDEVEMEDEEVEMEDDDEDVEMEDDDEGEVEAEEEEDTGAATSFRTMDIDDIKVVSPYKDLFTVDSDTVTAIAKDMEAYGYDISVPIVVNGKHQIVDGHTRLRAAKQAGLSEVFVHVLDYTDEGDGIEYAIHNQVDRRNMTNKGLLNAFKKIDKRMPKYEIGKKFGKGQNVESIESGINSWLCAKPAMGFLNYL